MSDPTPTPDTLPEVNGDPDSPSGDVDQLPYPDVDDITPGEDDDEEGSDDE